MPIFRVTIILSDGKRFDEFRDVHGANIETYYGTIRNQAEATYGDTLAYHDVVQIAERSMVGRYMRQKGWSKMQVRDVRIVGSGEVALGGLLVDGLRIP